MSGRLIPVDAGLDNDSPAWAKLARVRRMTDLGNAERLADRAQDKLLWVYGQGWLVWDGRRWQRDVSNRIGQLAADTARSIYAESSELSAAAGQAGDGDREALGAQAKKVLAWAIQSESRAKLDAMVKLGASQRRLVLEDGPAGLDARPTLLNVRNGVLDLDTLELEEHDPGLLLTKVARAAYDPDAEAPFFLATLERALPDPAIRRYVMKALAYSVLGQYSEYLFIPWGAGANLKSTLLYAVRHALGDYAAEAASDLLVVRREWGAAAESALAGLRGSRFVTTIETEQGKKLAEVLVKQLTGEAEITAKFMRQDYFTYTNQAAVWLATNHKPVVQGMDYAIWRRLRLIPFEQTVPPGERLDPAAVHGRLRDERDGILRWLVEALRMYHDEGLEPPDAVTSATEAYRAQMDPLSDWIEDELVVEEGAMAASGRLRSSYERHCRDSGRQPLGATRFNEELTRLGHPADKRYFEGKQQRVRHGVRIRPLDPVGF